MKMSVGDVSDRGNIIRKVQQRKQKTISFFYLLLGTWEYKYSFTQGTSYIAVMSRSPHIKRCQFYRVSYINC